jgi:hypothetical protein
MIDKLRSVPLFGTALMALVFVGAFAAPAHAWWRGGVWVGVAPAPYYYAPPHYYAPPPVVYAPPPVYYPPPAYSPYRPVWVPRHWNGWRWVPGHWA